MSPYPGGEVDGSSAVEQQRGHVDVPVVRGNVQRGEAALQRETALVNTHLLTQGQQLN